jgi:ATP-dependent Clp protease ATP-binding subunit ClpC
MAFFGRFTERAQKALIYAQEEARNLGHNYVGTEHLLLGLLREGEGAAAQALKSMGMDIKRFGSRWKTWWARAASILPKALDIPPHQKGDGAQLL